MAGFDPSQTLDAPEFRFLAGDEPVTAKTPAASIAVAGQNGGWLLGYVGCNQNFYRR
jgi:hypothetical protein